MEIVLYGAGKRGRTCYKFLKSSGYADVIFGFCDKRANEIKKVDDKKVWLPEELIQGNYIYCLTLADSREKEKIMGELGAEKCICFEDLPDIIHVDRVKFNRDFCGIIHSDNMSFYFDEAETSKSLEMFWDQNSVFYHMFQQLDIRDVIELACGRGRHVSNYEKRAQSITLVDILQENIDFCKKRFNGCNKISFYKNNGYDLRDLEANKYSALFSYDAMVHFELIDILTYMKDIYRVLKGGGRALLHHSNYHADYKAAFSSTSHGRSFMSKECFAYLAYRAGFVILDQKIIDWGIPELDCISLIEKPEIKC